MIATASHHSGRKRPFFRTATEASLLPKRIATVRASAEHDALRSVERDLPAAFTRDVAPAPAAENLAPRVVAISMIVMLASSALGASIASLLWGAP